MYFPSRSLWPSFPSYFLVILCIAYSFALTRISGGRYFCLFALLFISPFRFFVRFVSALFLRRCFSLFSCFRFWNHFRSVVLICSGMFSASSYAMLCTLFYNSIFQLKDNKNESKANKGKDDSTLGSCCANGRWSTK